MNWRDVQATYPNQWLLVEALEASSEGGRRTLTDVTIIGAYTDSMTAMEVYRELHREDPGRELYVLHSSLETPEIEERRWVGVRGAA